MRGSDATLLALGIAGTLFGEQFKIWIDGQVK
jgi:hypothetical protein